MIRYFKKYPFSLTALLLILYLSFFRPPKLEGPVVDWPYFDKVVHFCMYFGLSFLLWWESANKSGEPKRGRGQIWMKCLLLPILVGGVVELLQSLLTDYRSGDWLDFVANSAGALTASVLGGFFLFPLFKGRKKGSHP